MQELQTLEPEDGRTATSPHSRRSTIDTSRPFRSVKEAVATFGDRFLVGEIYTPKHFTFPENETPFFSPSPRIDEDPQWNRTSPRPTNNSCYGHEMMTPLSEIVKKLEAELEEAKNELKLLKERELEYEAALASLNAELRRNTSKLPEAEARRAMASRSVDDGAMIMREEENKRDGFLRMENGTNSRKLAQILSIGDEGLFIGRKHEKKVMKKKPIIPLVGDFFLKEKGKSS
ncbi:hypothetical protein OROHE_018841 [Orobanche hederae]